MYTFCRFVTTKSYKTSNDMKDKINKICTELNDGKIAVVQATEQLFDLYSVSQQRELLTSFANKWNMKNIDWEATWIDDEDIEEHLKDVNYG